MSHLKKKRRKKKRDQLSGSPWEHFITSSYYLDSVGGTFVGHITSQSLGDGSVIGVSPSLIKFPGSPHPSQTRCLDTDGHVSQHESHSLVFKNGDAESLSLHGIFHGFIVSSLSQTNGTSSHLGGKQVSLFFLQISDKTVAKIERIWF
jgi:hypothetical protein